MVLVVLVGGDRGSDGLNFNEQAFERICLAAWYHFKTSNKYSVFVTLERLARSSPLPLSRGS